MNRSYDNPTGKHVRDVISAYIDGQLTPAERSAVRAHIAECANCRADYIELRATKQLMMSVPVSPVPRAFTLSDDMVRQPARRASFWERILAPAQAPRLAVGSALAFVLLLVMMAAGLGNSQRNVSTTSLAQPPSVMSAPSGAAESATSATAADSSAKMAPPAMPTTAAGITDTTGASSASGAAPAATQPSEHYTLTPNTEVSGSGNSSPTTTTLQTQQFSDTATAQREAAPAPAPASTPFSLAQAAQLILLLAGLALGVAALVAWQRHA